MGRKVWATLVLVGGSLAAILGIIVDAPEAMKTVINLGPSWLENPDVWWVGIIVFITVLALCVVWLAGKRKASGPLATREEHLLFRVEVAVGRVNSAQAEAMSLPDPDRRSFVSRAINTEFETALAAAIYSLYGAQERDKYLRVIRVAKNDQDPLAMVKAATAYLGSFIMARSMERVDALQFGPQN